MLISDTVPRPIRWPLTDWAGRLAARLAGLQEQVRDGVIEAVGRTAAEAAEVVLRKLFGVGLPPARTNGSTCPDWEYSADPESDSESFGSWDDGVPDSDRREPANRSSALPRWSWRAMAVAGLQALTGWLRQTSSPVLAAAAAVAGAVLLLLN